MRILTLCILTILVGLEPGVGLALKRDSQVGGPILVSQCFAAIPLVFLCFSGCNDLLGAVTILENEFSVIGNFSPDEALLKMQRTTLLFCWFHRPNLCRNLIHLIND